MSLPHKLVHEKARNCGQPPGVAHLCGGVIDAPIFKPTLEEFHDPIAYIRQIQTLVAQYGICKVLPPVGSSVPANMVLNSSRASKFSFTARLQEVGSRVWTSWRSGDFYESARPYTLSDFDRAATAFAKEKFGTAATMPERMVEAAYWQEQLGPRRQGKEVEYGNDIEGSAFSADASDPLASSRWNLRVLPSEHDSLLRHLPAPVLGVSTPLLFVGMLFATFAWHVEDNCLYSINFHHAGAPKTWYGVPAEDAEKFETVVLERVLHKAIDAEMAKGSSRQEAETAALNVLINKTLIVCPNLLTECGVRVVRAVQQPGEFVVTLPRAYHSGFSNGYNIGEAVNFATPDWLPFGVQCAARYRRLKHQPIVSVEQLLCSYALERFADLLSAAKARPASPPAGTGCPPQQTSDQGRAAQWHSAAANPQACFQQHDVQYAASTVDGLEAPASVQQPFADTGQLTAHGQPVDTSSSTAEHADLMEARPPAALQQPAAERQPPNGCAAPLPQPVDADGPAVALPLQEAAPMQHDIDMADMAAGVTASDTSTATLHEQAVAAHRTAASLLPDDASPGPMQAALAALPDCDALTAAPPAHVAALAATPQAKAASAATPQAEAASAAIPQAKAADHQTSTIHTGPATTAEACPVAKQHETTAAERRPAAGAGASPQPYDATAATAFMQLMRWQNEARWQLSQRAKLVHKPAAVAPAPRTCQHCLDTCYLARVYWDGEGDAASCLRCALAAKPDADHPKRSAKVVYCRDLYMLELLAMQLELQGAGQQASPTAIHLVGDSLKDRRNGAQADMEADGALARACQWRTLPGVREFTVRQPMAQDAAKHSRVSTSSNASSETDESEAKSNHSRAAPSGHRHEAAPPANGQASPSGREHKAAVAAAAAGAVAKTLRTAHKRINYNEAGSDDDSSALVVKRACTVSARSGSRTSEAEHGRADSASGTARRRRLRQTAEGPSSSDACKGLAGASTLARKARKPGVMATVVPGGKAAMGTAPAATIGVGTLRRDSPTPVNGTAPPQPPLGLKSQATCWQHNGWNQGSPPRDLPTVNRNDLARVLHKMQQHQGGPSVTDVQLVAQQQQYISRLVQQSSGPLVVSAAEKQWLLTMEPRPQPGNAPKPGTSLPCKRKHAPGDSSTAGNNAAKKPALEPSRGVSSEVAAPKQAAMRIEAVPDHASRVAKLQLAAPRAAQHPVTRAEPPVAKMLPASSKKQDVKITVESRAQPASSSGKLAVPSNTKQKPLAALDSKQLQASQNGKGAGAKAAPTLSSGKPTSSTGKPALSSGKPTSSTGKPASNSGKPLGTTGSHRAGMAGAASHGSQTAVKKPAVIQPPGARNGKAAEAPQQNSKAPLEQQGAAPKAAAKICLIVKRTQRPSEDVDAAAKPTLGAAITRGTGARPPRAANGQQDAALEPSAQLAAARKHMPPSALTMRDAGTAAQAAPQAAAAPASAPIACSPTVCIPIHVTATAGTGPLPPAVSNGAQVDDDDDEDLLPLSSLKSVSEQAGSGRLSRQATGPATPASKQSRPAAPGDGPTPTTPAAGTSTAAGTRAGRAAAAVAAPQPAAGQQAEVAEPMAGATAERPAVAAPSPFEISGGYAWFLQAGATEPDEWDLLEEAEEDDMPIATMASLKSLCSDGPPMPPHMSAAAAAVQGALALPRPDGATPLAGARPQHVAVLANGKKLKLPLSALLDG